MGRPAQPSCGSCLYHLITMTFTLSLSDLYYCLPQPERDTEKETVRGKKKAIKGRRWVQDGKRKLLTCRHCWQRLHRDEMNLSAGPRMCVLWAQNQNLMHWATAGWLKITCRLQNCAKPQTQQRVRKQNFLHVTIANDHMSQSDRGEWSNQRPELIVSLAIIELKYNLCAVMPGCVGDSWLDITGHPQAIRWVKFKPDFSFKTWAIHNWEENVSIEPT